MRRVVVMVAALLSSGALTLGMAGVAHASSAQHANPNGVFLCCIAT